jgi:hypothetical protein
MPNTKKTLEELEQEFSDVMGCQAITDVTRFVPTNTSPEISENEILTRAEKYAPEMREVMSNFFNNPNE